MYFQMYAALVHKGLHLGESEDAQKDRSSKFSLQWGPSGLNKNPWVHNSFPSKTKATIFF